MSLFKIIKECEIYLDYCECGCKGTSVFEKCGDVSNEVAWIFLTEKNFRMYSGHGVSNRLIKSINTKNWSDGYEKINELIFSMYRNKKDIKIVEEFYNNIGDSI